LTSALLLLFSAAGFAGVYVYSRPEILSALGAGHWVNALPWRRAALAAAREHPLEFASLSLALCNADGTPLSPPRDSFTDVEISKAGHLEWIASFKNELAGLEDRKEAVSAQFFDPNGSPVASSSAERVIGSNDNSASFSAVAVDFTGHPLGRYRVVLSSGDKRLAEREFYVTEDLVAKAAAEAAKAQTEAAKEKAEAEGARQKLKAEQAKIEESERAAAERVQVLAERKAREEENRQSDFHSAPRLASDPRKNANHANASGH